MEFRICLISVIIIILVDKIDSVDWNYGKLGPAVWSKTFPECGEHSQSPVNIQTACTIQEKFQPFDFKPNDIQQVNFTLQNDGYTITAIPDGTKLLLSGGNLNGNYQFINFHLHWGPNENEGSEHQVNGVKFTGESHFVFENIQTKKLAVLGFFMKSQPNSTDEIKRRNNEYGFRANTQWGKYFDATQNLIKENDTTTINLNLFLLMGTNLNDFWRYNGSLTIPPCTQDVTWTVFKEPIFIYNYEFDSFRDDLLFESYRGPQPLFYRKIYRSFTHEILSDIPDQNCCTNYKSNANYLSLHYFFILFIFSFMFN